MDDINKRYKEISRNSRLSKDNTRVYTSIPTPTDSDYERGYILRFFLQKVNDTAAPIMEVSSIQYSSFRNNPLYAKTSLRWRITGPKEPLYDSNTNRLIDMGVRESNKKSLELASGPIPNLSLYFPNTTQFWKNI